MARQPVLAVGEPHAQRVVDAEGDDLAAKEPHKLVDGGVQFVAAAQHARAGHVVGLARQDRRDQRGDVVRVVRAVGVHKDEDVAGGFGDAAADGRALAAPVVQDDPRAAGAAMSRVPSMLCPSMTSSSSA